VQQDFPAPICTTFVIMPTLTTCRCKIIFKSVQNVSKKRVACTILEPPTKLLRTEIEQPLSSKEDFLAKAVYCLPYKNYCLSKWRVEVLRIRTGFDTDQDPRFYLNAYPRSRINVDPCGSGSWPGLANTMKVEFIHFALVSSR
jgi:hypothetical protein